MLFHKSRFKWIKEGDENSRFFHSIVNWRRKMNSVRGLHIQGSWVEDTTVVKNEIKRFFEKRFMEEENQCKISFEGLDFNTLNELQAAKLVEIFFEEEIKEAVWDCEGNKCPGPDGYNFSFIKACWGSLKEDVCRMMREFHANGVIPRGGNASFIVLIPKVENSQQLNHYRPISLVGCCYKILAKLLSKRLKVVLPCLIDEGQLAFLGGRNILDSVLVANETVDEVKKRKKSCLIFKADFEKAYDSVRWKFLYEILGIMKFLARWIRWIKKCVETPMIFVLVNGSPTGEFKMRKGLRQGDPLAPFLFLVVAEGLAALMRSAVAKRRFEGTKVGASNLSVSCLQFADDTVFFGEASIQNILTIKSILRCFEVASELRVNFSKSSLTGVGVDRRLIQMFADTLNCKLMAIPFLYLGLPVGANPRSLATWQPVIDKVKKRLSTWHQQQLSFGGRVCLIKSVLTAIPLYYLSMFRAPSKVITMLNSIQRNFLWGAKGDERKVAWVKWKECCNLKAKGGLGIKNIEKFNKALVGKWMWRVLNEKDELWVKLLEAKYGRGEEWFQKED